MIREIITNPENTAKPDIVVTLVVQLVLKVMLVHKDQKEKRVYPEMSE